MTEMDDVVREFLVESHENLDQLDRDLVALEEDPGDPATLASVFRTFHTIKGTSGFLGFARLEALTHLAEGLLSRLRDRTLALSAEIATALLRTTDAVRAMLAAIETTGGEGDGEYGELVATLSRLNAGEGAPEQEPEAEPGPAPAAPAAPRNGSAVSETNVRVDVQHLDRLMDLVGELVLARNQLLQCAGTRGQEDPQLLRTTQRLDLITSALQEGVMKTRMQPIGGVWSKLPRVVRDLARACGKQVVLEMEGRETELDRTIIEAIKDPLTHVVRNSVDHGIERPDVRVARGKRPEGTLALRAFHAGGQVVLEIADDGGGIDPARVRDAALRKGLITPEQAARMGERELQGLIFLPGFSTAAQVTNVSGRGVGMDVVRANVERIGGTVDVRSRVGAGTTLRVKIPLTLAIVPALVVTSGGDRYAIPQVNLLELVRLEGGAGRSAIELVHGAPVLRLRGRLLPLVHLDEVLGTADAAARARRGEGNVTVVVLQAGECPFGLVVDRILDTEEIVVKPLGEHLKHLGVFSGATIMGDGRVALILDVLGIAQAARVVGAARDRAPPVEVAAGAEEESAALLVFATPGDGCMAVPLARVRRLEELPTAAIEWTSDGPVMQYRGEIVPLVRVEEVLPERRRAPHAEAVPAGGTVPVIVCADGERGVGLVVGRIVDVVRGHTGSRRASTRPGVECSVVVQGRVTEVVDVGAVVRMAFPDARSAAGVATGGGAA